MAEAPPVLFKNFVALLEAVKKSKGKSKATRIKSFVTVQLVNTRIGEKPEPTFIRHFASFYLMYLHLKQLDQERKEYSIKEKTLAQIYIQVLGLNNQSPDANALLHYTNPDAIIIGSKCGDFCSVLEGILKLRIFHPSSQLTLDQVNLMLDDLAKSTGTRY